MYQHPTTQGARRRPGYLQLLRRLLKNYHIFFPFLTVMLFLAHPLHTEVVASLKNREEILSFLGVLLALKYFLKSLSDEMRMSGAA